MVRIVFLNQLSLLSIINQNKHVVYHAVHTAHAQNTHVVSIVITRLAISYRDSKWNYRDIYTIDTIVQA